MGGAAGAGDSNGRGKRMDDEVWPFQGYSGILDDVFFSLSRNGLRVG